ncbi:MAG TPA: MFS transporter [Candidatus Limnocylindria bacterium]|nr:MFS transporter [Candidatus Limnocylindria bacterium]
MEPSARGGWRSLLLVYGITSTVEAAGVSQIFAYLPLRLGEVGLPAADVPVFTGVFTSLIFVFGILLVPFWGVWADKYSRRAVIVRSAVVEAVVFAGVAWAREPWQLAVALLLTGLQLGNTGVMLAALRDVTPSGRIGTMSAIFGATSPIGFAVGPVLAGLLVDGAGLSLSAVFWLSAALSAGIAVLLLAATPEVRPEVVPTGRVITLATRAVTGVLRDAGVRRLFVVFGVAILANQMFRPFVPILVERIHGTAAGLASAIALVTGTAALAGALVSPVSGPLGDRIGFRPVLAVSLVAGGVAVGLMPLATGVLILAVLAAIYAAFQAAVQAMMFSLIATEAPPERRSATLNLVLLPLYVAGILGPSAGAVVVAVTGVEGVFPAAALVFLLGGLGVTGVLARVRRPRRGGA